VRLFIQKMIWWTQRRPKEAELREELQFHLDEERDRFHEEGLAQELAKWAAHRGLGNVALLEENMRVVWTWTFFEQFIQDVRYAVRMIFKNRSFAALAILSLALGIGASTAIYSFMDSILLRSLPVFDPSSLVILKWHSKPRIQNPDGASSASVIKGYRGSTFNDPDLGYTGDIFPFPAFEILQKNDSLFSSVFAYFPSQDLNVTNKTRADLAKGEFVSGDYFKGLGVPAAAGRLIGPDDDQNGAPGVAVVSAAFSQRFFGGPMDAPGQTIHINNVPIIVVGVTPPEFFGVDPGASPDVYLPIHTSVAVEAVSPFGIKPESYLDQNTYWIEIMARLRPGVELAQAQSALAPQFHQWVSSTAMDGSQRADLPALLVQKGEGGVEDLRRQYSRPLSILMMLVGLILAIACANIANLLLARAAAREGEMALRLSLGAGRFRLVRQLLTESVLLAFIGGTIGLLLAIWGIRFLTLLLANGQTDFTLHAELNWRVLGVSGIVSLLTGILFGLAPAIQSTRASMVPALKKFRASNARLRIRTNLSHMLIVGQIVLSLLMLMAAGLFVRTLLKLRSVELGFNRENVLLFELNARQAGHRDPEITYLYDDLQKRFSGIPGVRNVTLANASLIGDGTWGTTVSVSGKPAPGTMFLAVGPAFFSTMQIPIEIGREIDERDQPNSTAVAVVNELFAKVNFGDKNPIGRHFILGEGRITPRDIEIVGVSKNARYGDLKKDIPPVVYVPYSQGPYPMDQMTYAVRTTGNPLAQVNTIRKIVHQADDRVPVANVRTQAAQIDQTINQEITFAKLCSGLAILALVIASVGLYGSVSYNIARRTSEIGIRMALGAQRSAVVWMVLREVFALVVMGLAISLPTAFGTSKLVESFLFGMKANDPLALLLAVVVLTTATMVAGYLPARKASRIDPVIALRHE
jgi:macrolide transport system ATP-binding/permease protein